MFRAEAGAQPLVRSPSPAFFELLLRLEERESVFVERIYDIFFEGCPEALPLFGEYALSEREEMVRETFRSILAIAEGASWIDANLVALGRSHVEYGAEPSMYPPFVEAFLDAATQTLAPDALDPEARATLEAHLLRIAQVMADA